MAISTPWPRPTYPGDFLFVKVYYRPVGNSFKVDVVEDGPEDSNYTNLDSLEVRLCPQTLYEIVFGQFNIHFEGDDIEQNADAYRSRFRILGGNNSIIPPAIAKIQQIPCGPIDPFQPGNSFVQDQEMRGFFFCTEEDDYTIIYQHKSLLFFDNTCEINWGPGDGSGGGGLGASVFGIRAVAEGGANNLETITSNPDWE